MMLDPPAATGGNAGQSTQQAGMPMVADQTSPPRKLLRQHVGGSGQDLSAVQAGGNPVAQSPDMAEETVVERVTRRSSSKYSQPQATELKHEIFELTQALQNTRFLAAEEISQYHTHFEGCARTYEAEARETSAVEVARAVAPIASQLQNAEGHIVAIKSQLQDAYDRKGSSDISTRQLENAAQQQFDNLQEQLHLANQKLWHVEQDAENVVARVENKAQALETETEARHKATLQQEAISTRKGHLLEESLNQERMRHMLTLEEGQMLEETLRKSMSQQSRDAQFQQNVDIKNQQLEAQIAKAQLEKAESDSKLSIQNEQLEQLRAHYESNRIRELSLLQASQALQASQPGGMAPAHPSYEWHKQKPPESGLSPAGGNPLTRSDEPKPSAWQPTSVPPPA